MSERAPDARLPPAQAVASAVTCNGKQSWQTAPVQILSSLRSPCSNDHHEVKQTAFAPAAQPAHPPAINLLAQLHRLAQAKEFGLQLHNCSRHIHPSVGLDSQLATRPAAASTTKPDTEVESMTMAKNVLPFPAPDAGAARPTAVEQCRATFQIGARRFVFEFRTAVSEVNPVDAEIVSIRTGQICLPRNPAVSGLAGLVNSATKRSRSEESSAQTPSLPNGARKR